MRRLLAVGLVVGVAAALLVSGCLGSSGGAEDADQPNATLERYWGAIDNGSYSEARDLVVGEKLFEDNLYGRGDVDTESYAAFGESGENLTVDGVRVDTVIEASPGNEQLEALGADEGYLVNYAVDGLLVRPGPRGTYERDISNDTMADLVVKKDGEWRIAPGMP